MSLFKRLVDEIYVDRLLIAVKWVGFVVCLVVLAIIVFRGFFSFGIYDSYLREAGELIDPVPRAKVETLLHTLEADLRSQAIMAIIVLVYLGFHLIYLRLAENARTR